MPLAGRARTSLIIRSADGDFDGTLWPVLRCLLFLTLQIFKLIHAVRHPPPAQKLNTATHKENANNRRLSMRLAGRERLGFYPLPIPEAERMRKFLAFPDKQCCALDPCVGDGAAFAEIASDKNVQRCGVELDAGRAEQARTSGIEVIHGNCFDVQCPVESFSLIYLNPPYDFEIGEEKSQRMEKLFLEHVRRWLIRGGILVF